MYILNISLPRVVKVEYAEVKMEGRKRAWLARIFFFCILFVYHIPGFPDLAFPWWCSQKSKGTLYCAAGGETSWVQYCSTTSVLTSCMQM